MSAPRVLAADHDHPDPRVIEEAARVIRGGGLVAFPTETLYGLAADPWNRDALERILRVKGRSAGKGIPVIVGSFGAIARIAGELSPAARDLAARHWPGPLTLVLPALPDLPAAVAPDGVAVRWSSGRVAARLARASGGAITATSANPSGDTVPALDPARVVALLGAGVDLVIDAGVLAECAASTLVDARGASPKILRHGPIDPFARAASDRVRAR